MLFSTWSSRKNKESPCTDDNELKSLIPPKREKMQVSTPANGAPCIKIEQLVKHDVWDIRRKNDGAFVMKKLDENDTGASSANTSTVTIDAGNRTNAEQTGARRKVIVEVPKTDNTVTLNATNRLQNVNHVNNTVTAKPVTSPRMEILKPERSVITLMPMNAQKHSVITMNTTPAPHKEVISVKTTAPENVTVNAGTAPRKGVITINTTPLPKKEVISISATPLPKKEVITINTRPLSKPAVFTINTCTKKDEKPSAHQIQDNVNMRKQTMHNIWNVPKEENRYAAASTLVKDIPVSREKSDDQSSRIPSYSDEVYQIQEMFPQVPLNVISDRLKVSGSVESTVDILLAEAYEEPVPSSEMPPAAPKDDDDDVIFLKSVKADKPKADDISGSKKGNSVIKIELLTRNEVWDINGKEEEGFVMKKTAEDGIKDDETKSQCSKPVDKISCTDDHVEVTEEEHGDPLLEDLFLDAVSHVGSSEQSNVPVKLMVYSQSCGNGSPTPIRKVTPPCGRDLDSGMEIDSFDNSCSSPEEKVSIEAFEFSDDENEDGETVEHFLFKASLVLKKLKYRSEIQAPRNPALLNITGSMMNEETNVAKEACSDDDDDEYYTDECYTDEGD